MIGNNNYAGDSRLKWAVADARAMRDKLATMGFEVLYAENADQRKMQDLVHELLEKAKDDLNEVGTSFWCP